MVNDSVDVTKSHLKKFLSGLRKNLDPDPYSVLRTDPNPFTVKGIRNTEREGKRYFSLETGGKKEKTAGQSQLPVKSKSILL